MEKPDGNLTNAHYPWLLTIYETLELVMKHCDEAELAQDEWALGLHLKMAARAMRCALEIFGEHLDKEKVK